MVAFDNTILSLLLFPDAELNQGPDGRAVEFAKERVFGLVKELEEAREQVVVPTPALAELLVADGVDVQSVLAVLRGSAYIRVEGFDERAAVELAARLREARRRGNAKEGLPITKSAMKFDRQIVAIALVGGARVLYADDAGVARFAEGCGLPVRAVMDLPIPAKQGELGFEELAE